MDEAGERAREIAEAALGHPVPYVLAAEDGRPIVAASVAGEPPAARVAWLTPEGEVIARVACPPGRPSRWRPVVAAADRLAGRVDGVDRDDRDLGRDPRQREALAAGRDRGRLARPGISELRFDGSSVSGR